MDKKYKDTARNLGVEVGKAVAKKGIEALGDKMERAKRPFWRKLVAFFRGR